jgi:hypothetical protein
MRLRRRWTLRRRPTPAPRLPWWPRPCVRGPSRRQAQRRARACCWRHSGGQALPAARAENGSEKDSQAAAADARQAALWRRWRRPAPRPSARVWARPADATPCGLERPPMADHRVYPIQSLRPCHAAAAAGEPAASCRSAAFGMLAWRGGGALGPRACRSPARPWRPPHVKVPLCLQPLGARERDGAALPVGGRGVGRRLC